MFSSAVNVFSCIVSLSILWSHRSSSPSPAPPQIFCGSLTCAGESSSSHHLHHGASVTFVLTAVLVALVFGIVLGILVTHRHHTRECEEPSESEPSAPPANFVQRGLDIFGFQAAETKSQSGSKASALSLRPRKGPVTPSSKKHDISVR